MSAASTRPASNRARRTRRDILDATARLAEEGGVPSVEEIAEEALVSRATVYRYFPSHDALLAEAALHRQLPTAEVFFADDSEGSGGAAGDGARARLTRVADLLHDFSYANEELMRRSLAYAYTAERGPGRLVRQNRRTPLIEAALEPLADRLDTAARERLAAALALMIGTESMIVYRDVLPMDPEEARALKHWAAEALVRAALEDAR